MATIAAAAAAKARRGLQHAFFSLDAVQPDRAITFSPGGFAQRRLFDRWRRAGIIRDAEPGLYWLDLVAYDAELRRRHRLVKLSLSVILAALAVWGLISSSG